MNLYRHSTISPLAVNNAGGARLLSRPDGPSNLSFSMTLCLELTSSPNNRSAATQPATCWREPE